MPSESDKRFTVSDFRYDSKQAAYICPNNKLLSKYYVQQREDSTQYRCNYCGGCPLKTKCLLPKGTYRTLTVWNQHHLIEEMNRKNELPIGVEMAKKRSATVEPLFGYLKASKKLRQFFFRGMNMINAMWKLELAAYNVEKLAKYLRKQRPVMA